MSQLEKAWHVKLKSVEYQEKGDPAVGMDGPHYLLVMEFTKDLNKAELAGVSQATAWRIDGGHSGPCVERLFFDTNNVLVKHDRGCTKSGKITGLKGHTFRVIVEPPCVSGVARAELRLGKG